MIRITPDDEASLPIGTDNERTRIGTIESTNSYLMHLL